MTVLVSYSLLRLSARGTYLLAVDATVISPDGEELVTSDGETVGLDMGGVAEGRSKTGDLLRRNLKYSLIHNPDRPLVGKVGGLCSHTVKPGD